MLVFLAPDRTRLNDLEQTARKYLAWKSIADEHELLNLNAFERNQAHSKAEQTEATLKRQLIDTYCWVLVPIQPDPKGSVDWQEVRLQGNGDFIGRVSRKLINEESLIVKFSATRVRMELDAHLWHDVAHLNTKKLWEYFSSYPYLPRLKNQEVLQEAIQEGVASLTWQDAFAYAEAYDEGQSKYLGLKAGQVAGVVFDSQSILVKPELAQEQLDAERPKSLERPEGVEGDEGGEVREGQQPAPGAAGGDGRPHRFFGTVTVDPTRLTSEAGKIAEEIVQHLAGLVDAEVKIRLDIEANVPEGVPDNIVRTVTENCRTLKFDEQGFEED